MEMATPTSKLLPEDTMPVLDRSEHVKVETSGICIPIIDLADLDRSEHVKVETSGICIPIIDLADLASPDRRKVVEEIGNASLNPGIFQVRNHGIPASLITDMLMVAKQFFKLPESERKKSNTGYPMRPTGASADSRVNTERGKIWKDFLRIQCYPLEDFIHEWPSNPANFRPVVSEYSKYVRDLALKLLKAISESLGLESLYIEKALGKQGQRMAINYYPPQLEPKPELTKGVPEHKDPNAISILLQDEVPGLQALLNDIWVPVDPIPDTFTIIIGDQIEVISNGRYKSLVHRALLNRSKERISIPTFYSPSSDAVMKPAEVLVDVEHPANYRSFVYGEYYDMFLNGGRRAESFVNWLDMFKNKY